MSSCCAGQPNQEIDKLEAEILEKKQRLAELKRSAPAMEAQDYTFLTHDGSGIRLSELFSGKKDLIVVHNMGTTCPYCTMWADGFTGLTPHLRDRAAFVLVSNDPPEVQKKFAQSRNWSFPMVSCKDTSFFKDMGFVSDGANPFGHHFNPGVSSFKKTGDKIFRVAKAGFGPGDEFCAAWHFFDLLEKGADGWEPKFKY